MNNDELRELVHLLLMCGIMDKTATESGNVTDEEWLRMKNLIKQYQTEGGINCEPDKSGDLISREALKKAIEEVEDNYDGYEPNDLGKFMCKVYDIIDNTPTVKPEIPTELCKGCRFLKDCETCEDKVRPQGEWAEFEGGYRCSNCDDIEVYTPNFCPNCGADMWKV